MINLLLATLIVALLLALKAVYVASFMVLARGARTDIMSARMYDFGKMLIGIGVTGFIAVAAYFAVDGVAASRLYSLLLLNGVVFFNGLALVIASFAKGE